MKEVVGNVTVTTLAKRLGLSRSRLYQLVDAGIFPKPLRTAKTNRPYYDETLQAQCLLIRKTSCGMHGEPVLFYSRRSKVDDRIQPKARDGKKQPVDGLSKKKDSLIDELLHGLIQLGMPRVGRAAIQAALAESYPEGHDEIETSELLMVVFRCLKRRESA